MVIKHKTQDQDINSEFERFLARNKHRFKSDENIKLLRKAFNFASKAHKDTIHFSGKQYIYHPLEVAKIISDKIGLGTTSAVAALLHDVPNNTEYDLEDIKQYFGDKIYGIVSGLKKIKNTEYFDNNAQASIFRQILLHISDDIRVIFVKIADKLHNIREIEHIPYAKRYKTIEDILNIYAPLAHRLGLYEIKTEMEDLCLKSSNPYTYNKINTQLQSSERERIQFINRFIIPIKEQLNKINIKYEIKGRSKSIYSIWKKMQKKDVPLDEIYDLFAVRIIFKPSSVVSENSEALQIGNIITDLYKEKKDRNRNWLKVSKDTGYRALHITVMSDEGKWVEIQVRSEEMHEVAEYGLASHWKYKGLKEKKTEFDEKVRDLLEYLSEDNSSAITFIDNLKLNLLTTEISVFTPQGEVVTLPKGASILDFAFKIHTDLGMKSIAGKVNGKSYGLDYRLKNGDQVELITTKKDNIQKEWLNIVISQRAISKIKLYFRADIQENIEKGKKILEDVLKNNEQKNIGKCVDNVSKYLNYKDKNKLFEDLGENKIKSKTLNEAVKKFCLNEKSTKFWDIKIPFYNKVKQDDKTQLPKAYKTAKCCNPLPGNEIIGIKASDGNDFIYIHDKNCLTANTEINLGAISIAVNWTSYKAISVLKKIKITGTDKPGILNKIIKIISEDLYIKLKLLNFYTTGSNTFSVVIELYFNEEKYTLNIISKLNKLQDIDNVYLIN